MVSSGNEDILPEQKFTFFFWKVFLNEGSHMDIDSCVENALHTPVTLCILFVP